MQSIDSRLRLAATVRQAWEALTAAGEQAHELGFVDLSLQLLDAETQLLKLHDELVQLRRDAPALRGWPALQQGPEQLPF